MQIVLLAMPIGSVKSSATRSTLFIDNHHCSSQVAVDAGCLAAAKVSISAVAIKTNLPSRAVGSCPRWGLAHATVITEEWQGSVPNRRSASRAGLTGVVALMRVAILAMSTPHAVLVALQVGVLLATCIVIAAIDLVGTRCLEEGVDHASVPRLLTIALWRTKPAIRPRLVAVVTCTV